MSTLSQRARRLAQSNTPSRRRARLAAAMNNSFQQDVNHHDDAHLEGTTNKGGRIPMRRTASNPSPSPSPSVSLSVSVSRNPQRSTKNSFGKSSSFPKTPPVAPVTITPTSGNSPERAGFHGQPKVVLKPEIIKPTMTFSFDMDEEEMPMDELNDIKRQMDKAEKSAGIGRQEKVVPQPIQKSHPVTVVNMDAGLNQSVETIDAADRGGGSFLIPPRGEVVEGDTTTSSSVGRLLAAMQEKDSERPLDLSSEEEALWDVMQSSLAEQRDESLEKRRNLERQLLDSRSQLEHVRGQNTNLQGELEETSKTITSLKTELQTVKSNQSKHSEDSRLHRATGTIRARRLEEKVAALERKNKEAEELNFAQQDEHDRAIRAIQRVLADVTTKKEAESETLQAQIVTLESERENLKKELHVLTSRTDKVQHIAEKDASLLQHHIQRAKDLEHEISELKTTLRRVVDERGTLKRKLDANDQQFLVVEKELKFVKTKLHRARADEEKLRHLVEEQKAQVETLEDELYSLKKQLDSQQDTNQLAATKIEEKDAVIKQLRAQLKEQKEIMLSQEKSTKASKSKLDDVAQLQKTLESKEKSLENAKMLIASLENANGSMASEMRRKLRDKEDRVINLELEANDKQRALDSLGMELRQLRREKGENDTLNREAQKEKAKQRGLAKSLEKAVSDLQSAAVVHESTAGNGMPDEEVIDQISVILCNALMALRMSISDLEGDDTGSEVSLSMSNVSGIDQNELGRHIDAIIRNDREAAAMGLREELEEKSVALKKQEASLGQYKQEMELLKEENKGLRIAQENQEAKLNSEIRQLRDQCQTNSDLLTKKEQELQVLRDSLEVNDGVGYISGDDSDGDGDDGPGAFPTLGDADSASYSAAQTGALATLLVHSNSGVEKVSKAASSEMSRLKKDFQKAIRDKERMSTELDSERESLANAKMIISSLERANKTMLEDLRSRLQDSNTAISSLLDKSMESETETRTLKQQVENLEAEKKKVEEEHSAQLSKMKEEALAGALRLAAKEQEISSLRQHFAEASPESRSDDDGN